MYAALTNPALTISLDGFTDGPGCRCDAPCCACTPGMHFSSVNVLSTIWSSCLRRKAQYSKERHSSSFHL